MDAIYCADEFDQCRSILSSVNRVLKPSGVFAFLSYSRPEFLLPVIASIDGSRPKWESVQVQRLESIMLYRLQKVAKLERSKQPTLKRRRWTCCTGVTAYICSFSPCMNKSITCSLSSSILQYPNWPFGIAWMHAGRDVKLVPGITDRPLMHCKS